jgi:hypothetical protein
VAIFVVVVTDVDDFMCSHFVCHLIISSLLIPSFSVGLKATFEECEIFGENVEDDGLRWSAMACDGPIGCNNRNPYYDIVQPS